MPLIANKVAEKDLRDHLSQQGYYGRTAKIHELELLAIQRPGWKQVFSFQLSAKDEQDNWHELRGLLMDDERSHYFVEFIENDEHWNQRLQELSQEYIIRGQRSPMTLWPLYLIAAVGLLAAITFANLQS